MAKSLAMKIADEVKSMLTTPAMTSVAIPDVRTEPIHPTELESGTAINIEMGNEDPAQRIYIGRKDRQVRLELTFIATGASAVTNADAAMVEAHERLMQDETLGGLAFDIEEAEVTRQNALNGQRLAVIRKVYLVQYLTREESLQT